MTDDVTNDTSASSAAQRAQLRRWVYALLIAVAAGGMLGRLMAVDTVDMIGLSEQRVKEIPHKVEERRQTLEARNVPPEKIQRDLEYYRWRLRQDAYLQRPGLSANDRSRWCTLRALVEPEMRVYRDDPDAQGEQKQWVPYAIDKVIQTKHWDTIDMVKHTLPDDPDGEAYLYSSKPPLLPTVMAVPYWVLYNTTGLSLGTHPFSVVRILLVLINVVPMVLMLVLLADLAERWGTTDWGRIFVVASGSFATLLTTFVIVLNNHIPGAFCAMVALYAGARIWIDGRRQFGWFALAAFFAAFLVACELPGLAFFGALGLALLVKAPRPTLIAGVPAALVVVAAFFVTNWAAHGSFIPPYAHRSEGENWYDYTYERQGRTYESYWRNRVGIDRGEPSRAVYAFHVLVGHHGIFSLTPIWILALCGMALWIANPPKVELRWLTLLIASISLIVLLFYLARGQDDRNYGGMTAGFRWMFWFAPLWLTTMLPAADRVAQSRVLRVVAIVLLAASVFSVAYPTWNPWTHPWLYHYMHYHGLIGP